MKWHNTRNSKTPGDCLLHTVIFWCQSGVWRFLCLFLQSPLRAVVPPLCPPAKLPSLWYSWNMWPSCPKMITSVHIWWLHSLSIFMPTDLVKKKTKNSFGKMQFFTEEKAAITLGTWYRYISFPSFYIHCNCSQFVPTGMRSTYFVHAVLQNANPACRHSELRAEDFISCNLLSYTVQAEMCKHRK